MLLAVCLLHGFTSGKKQHGCFQTQNTLVEDIKLVQKTAAMLLTALGCQVDTADNGSEAIKQFKANQYDLIFMDIGLPDIDGFTVSETIRNLEDSSNQTAIVALTAHKEDEPKQKALESGMNDFISKPLTPEQARRVLYEFTTKD